MGVTQFVSEEVKSYKSAPIKDQASTVRDKVATPVAKKSKQIIRVKLKAYEHRILDQSAQQIVDTAIRTGAMVIGPVPLPTRISKYTVIRSPHVDKRSMEAFEMRTHKRLVDILDPSPKTIDALMQLSLPVGVGIEIKM